MIVGPKQNAGSLLTAVSDTVLYAPLYGTLGFALHGSFFNHFLIGQNSSTANQNLFKKAVFGAAMEKKMLATM